LLQFGATKEAAMFFCLGQQVFDRNRQGGFSDQAVNAG